MQARQNYHKEDLRRDLLLAGGEWVRQHGHAKLSIRTLAQQVGVSPGAPYHHFADRRALLLALAVDGFSAMLDQSRQACAAATSAQDRLRAMGVAFIEFAQTNPHLVDLMYESELTSPTLDPVLLDYQIAGHDMLRQQILAACPQIDSAEADLRIIAYWSAIYGFASMRKKGVIHPSRAIPAMQDLGAAVVDRALKAAIND